MSELYIHIGIPKCGNTFFLKNFYPNIKDITFVNGQKKNLLSIPDVNSKILFFDGRISGFYNINKFSCDGYLYVDRISKVFPDANIIIGRRNIDSLSVSLYNQYVKTGGVESFDRWFNGFIKSKSYDVDGFIEYVCSVFDNVYIYDFDVFKKDSNVVIKNICSFIGVDVPIVDNVVQNGSISSYVLFVKHKINLVRRFFNV